MKHKNIPKWLILPMLFLLVIGLFVPCIASADPATAVTVQPTPKVVGIGDTFAMNISVDPDTDIKGMQFSLSFDPSLVTANGVTEGNLLSQGGASTFFMSGTIDNVAGTIIGVVGAIMGANLTVSSPGTFATISFTATAAGNSTLHLSNVIVGNVSGQAVAITVTDGSVTVTGEAAEYTITFDTDPEATGTITFDGFSYSDGNTVDKTAGTYAIAANPAGGYNFASWATTGSLSVAVPTSASTTCNVSGAGTLSMVQTPPPEYTITFDTDPEATGSITFASVSYSDGNTVNKVANTYNIVAVPGAGYYFDSWQTTGSLLVAAPGLASTTCTVSGAGMLRMVQTTEEPEEYTVTFDTDPEATGSITFASVSYSDGNTVNKVANTYNIVAAPASGYYFDKWETTGSLLVTTPTSATTTCVVSGTGTLRMVLTTTPPPVGGTAHPISKVAILRLWIAVGAVIAGASLLVLRRRRAQS